LIIRRLYGRLFDSIVATWAVSLITTQAMLIFVGQSLPGIPTPLGSFRVGDLSFSEYRAVLIAIASALLFTLYLVFMKTRIGMYARAAVQDADMASALGLDTSMVNAFTFATGAGLAGLAGGLYAPMMITTPLMGAAFIVKSFITVVVGGTNVLVGMGPAAAVLATFQTGIGTIYGQTIAQIGLLMTVIMFLRFAPRGMSGLFLRGRNV
jgi:urea transport system permease protein